MGNTESTKVQGMGIGSAIGGIAQGLGSILTIGAQKRAATKQFERQKELQEHAGEKQMDIWNRTNYGAQVDHMKRAGLNPALMYGMGGGAGGTTGSVGTGQANQENVMDIGGAVAQNRLVQAQVENLKAQTQKTEVEAEKIAGVDTEKTTAETGLTNIQAELQRINAEVAGRTKEQAISYIKDNADKMLAETVQAQIKQTIDERTYNDRVNQIKQESIGAMLENQLRDTNIRLNEERIKEIAENIVQRWEQIRLQGEGIDASLKNMEKLTEAMLWGAGINAAGNLVGDVIDVVSKTRGQNIQRDRIDNKNYNR